MMTTSIAILTPNIATPSVVASVGQSSVLVASSVETTHSGMN